MENPDLNDFGWQVILLPLVSVLNWSVYMVRTAAAAGQAAGPAVTFHLLLQLLVVLLQAYAMQNLLL